MIDSELENLYEVETKVLVQANPFVFTEQGVAMLSTVMNSTRAILVNIEIMLEFVRLRKAQTDHPDLERKVA